MTRGPAGWCVVFVAGLILYAATASRGIQWQDSGQRILRVVQRDVIGDLGLALSHPLHHWLGRLLAAPGWLEPAMAVTLLSAIMGAAALANVFGCVRTLTGRWQAAIYAAVSLGLAHTFWMMATITETYTLAVALLAAECWCLVGLMRGRRVCLAGMFLFNGLGLANHLLAVLTLPVLVGVAVIAVRRRLAGGREVVAAAVAWVVGSLPYTLLVASELLRTGDVPGTINSALFGTVYASNVLNTSLPLKLLAISAAFVIYNFPNLLLPAAGLGVVQAPAVGVQPVVRWALVAEMIIHALFVLRYNVVDQYTFLVPLYGLLCIFGGVGVAAVMSWQPSRLRRTVVVVGIVLAVMTPAWYVVAPAVARHYNVLASAPAKPYRDNYTYLLVPWSVAERSAEQLSSEAVRLAGPHGAILYRDRMGAFAVEYKRAMAGYEKLTIVGMPDMRTAEGRNRLHEIILAAGRGRVVYVPTDVRKPAPTPPDGTVWVRRGDLFVLEQTPATGPQ